MKKLMLWLLLVAFSSAADEREWRVPLDETTIKSNQYGAEATLSVNEDGNLKLAILLNGNQVIIPERALVPIKGANIGTAAFSTMTPIGVSFDEWKLKGGIILSFYYGKRVTQGFGKNSRDGILSACRLIISNDGNYERIETAIPQGQNSFRWSVLIQSKDGKDIRREMVESPRCPISMRWNDCE